MKLFRYYSPYRPPMWDWVPNGAMNLCIWGSRPYIPEIGHSVWGTVDFPYQLPQAVADYYGLLPANMVQQPIEWTEGKKYA